jgi:hypothetical protein
MKKIKQKQQHVQICTPYTQCFKEEITSLYTTSCIPLHSYAYDPIGKNYIWLNKQSQKLHDEQNKL